MIAVPPLLSALRWRLGASAALLAVAVIAVFTAAAGPLFLGAAETEVLHATLSSAGFDQTLITGENSSAAVGAVRIVQKLTPLAEQVGLTQWYGPSVITQDHGMRVDGNIADLVARAGVCAHLDFVAGHCATKRNQIVITERDSTALGRTVGDVLKVPKVGKLTVTGVIAVGNPQLRYWLGDDFFGFYPPQAHKPGNYDAFFTPASTVRSLPVVASAQFPLLVPNTQVATVDQLRDSVSQFLVQARTRLGLAATTQVTSSLGSYRGAASSIESIVEVVALQLLLLTLFVLYILVARTAAARRSEVALARLRGANTSSLLVIGMAEPVLILLLALPIGLFLAWLGMELASALTLGGAPVPFSLLAVLAGLVAFLSGLVAIAAGSRRALTRRLIDELRATEEKPSPLARAAWEGAAVALAVAGLLELATAGVLSGSHPNPIALFAPGLIAVGIAVPGMRVLPLAGHFVIRRTRHSRRVAAGLAVRQVVRRPAVLRQVLILTVAVALSAFAIVGWSVAGTNRSLRADFDVGAARVVKVKVPAAVNLLEAVRRADPSGNYAMAAMESTADGQHLLAVDPSRLAQVAYWADSITGARLQQIVHWLEPTYTPALVLTGSETRVTVNLSRAVNPPPDLQVAMLDSGGNAESADFGYLSPGTHTYTASLPPACVGGCRVTSLTPVVVQGPADTTTVRYTIAMSDLQQRQASMWHSINPRIYRATYWRANSSAAKLAGSATTLTMGIRDNEAQSISPGVIPAPLPGTLPAVSTVTSQPFDPLDNSIEDFDDTPLVANTRLEVSAIPRLGSVGTLMSLTVATRAETGTPINTSDYVWLAPGAPSGILHRLTAAGVRITSVQTPAPLEARYNNGGLGLGYRFFVFAAAAAAALAVASTILTFFLTARRRAFELAVLRALGVPTSTLLRSLILEQGVVLGPGLVLGIAAALIAAVVALPAVPEFGSNIGQPPLQLGLPLLPLIGLGVVLLVMLSAAAVWAAVLAVRRVDLRRLRLEAR
ncbi:MAG: FtsX-like permease family protein [Candidatus Dormiibacterota bacterium]